MKSFATLVKASKNGAVFLVVATTLGKKAWYYIKVDELKKPLLLKATQNGKLNLEEYGKILYSGWGEKPPEEITKKVTN